MCNADEDVAFGVILRWNVNIWLVWYKFVWLTYLREFCDQSTCSGNLTRLRGHEPACLHNMHGTTRFLL